MERTIQVCFLAALSAIFATGVIAAEPDLAGKAAILEIGPNAFIRHAETKWILSTLERAESEGAAVVVFDIETEGGLARPTREIVEKVTSMKVPTVAFIGEQATGPGALLALAAGKVRMDSGAEWGGEIPDIEWRERKDELPPRLIDRGWIDEMPDLLTMFASRQAPESVVRGFVNSDNEVRVDGKLVASDGELLLLDLKLAQGTFEGGKKLDVAEAGDVAGALKSIGVDSPMVNLKWEPPVEDGEDSAVADSEKNVESGAAKATDGASEEEERTFGETRQRDYTGKIVVLEIGDDTLLYKTKFEYLQRVIKKAEEDRAEAIIFEMNTPGGAAWDTAEIMMKDLADVKVPTYTFVNPNAVSAGSLIAVATDHIYMHRPSNIGSAGVVTSMGELTGTMKQKAESLFKSVGRGVARAKGHPEDIVEAWIDKEVEVTRTIPVITSAGWVSPKVLMISEKEKMLNLDADQATQLIDGKPLLAEGIAQTIEEVVKLAGLRGEIVRAEPLGFEMVSDWIVKFSGWLLLFGIAGAYMELKAPGFGLPGAISLVCFGLFFFGQNVAGHLAGYEAVGVFLLGAVLIVVEFFILPGLLLPGLLGFLLMIGALVYAMIDPGDLADGAGVFSFDGVGAALSYPLMTMTWALGGSVVAILLIIRYLPGSPMFKWMTLDEALPSGASMGELTVGSAADGSGGDSLLGSEGGAMTDLRPTGKVQFGDDVKDVVTSGEFIAEGTKVRVIEASGMRVVVEAIEES